MRGSLGVARLLSSDGGGSRVLGATHELDADGSGRDRRPTAEAWAEALA